MLSFGSDPEFMLVDKEGRYFSAIPIVPGDIAQRYHVGEYAFYWDNVLAECAIKPAASAAEAVDNFRECFQIYAKIVAPYRLKPQAAQRYPKIELLTKEAVCAGCAPDTCAYAFKQMKPPTRIIEQTRLRTAGGHIHLGSDQGFLPEDDWRTVLCVRLLDLFVGIPSLFLDHDPTSTLRRDAYGQAGRYRKKDYGLEYRSLSNFWLASPTLVELIYDLCKFTVDLVTNELYQNLYVCKKELFEEKPKQAFQCLLYGEDLLRRCLRRNDKEQAEQYFLKLVQEYLPAELFSRVARWSEPCQFDFYTEWGIV